MPTYQALNGHEGREGNTSVPSVLLTVRENVYLSVQTGDLTQHVLYTPHHCETHKTALTIITARQSIQPRTQIELLEERVCSQGDCVVEHSVDL